MKGSLKGASGIINFGHLEGGDVKVREKYAKALVERLQDETTPRGVNNLIKTIKYRRSNRARRIITSHFESFDAEIMSPTT